MSRVFEETPLNQSTSAPSSASSSWLQIIENDIKSQKEVPINNSMENLSIKPQPKFGGVPLNFTETAPINAFNFSPCTTTTTLPNISPLPIINQPINNIPFNTNPYTNNTIYSTFELDNNSFPSSSNGFAFPATTYQQSNNHNNIQNENSQNNTNIFNLNQINQINESLTTKVNMIGTNNNSNICVRSITVKFLTMYYNALHLNPMTLRRFYHLNAKIDRSDLQQNTEDSHNPHIENNEFHKLGLLQNVLFVDIENIIHQKSINNSILIRVNGIMKFAKNIQQHFEQIFLINKSKGFWLIENDLFWLIRHSSNNNHVAIDKEIAQTFVNFNDTNIHNKENINHMNHNNFQNQNYDHNQNQNKHLNNHSESKSYKSVINSQQQQAQNINNRRQQHPRNAHLSNSNYINNVNKRMINKFYHDASYQKFDNNLAIFIRGIPNNITHSKLCGLLRSSLLKQSAYTQHTDVCIDYIDVNYHKQFAFVYCGNKETLNVALQMGEININGNLCQIQRKRSHNGPRKFLPKKRNETVPSPFC